MASGYRGEIAVCSSCSLSALKPSFRKDHADESSKPGQTQGLWFRLEHREEDLGEAATIAFSLIKIEACVASILFDLVTR